LRPAGGARGATVTGTAMCLDLTHPRREAARAASIGKPMPFPRPLVAAWFGATPDQGANCCPSLSNATFELLCGPWVFRTGNNSDMLCWPGDSSGSYLMGFAATALYFENRAKKERDHDARARVQEVAGFYRMLAGITPDFPPGFNANGKGASHTDRFRARAEECRTMADHFENPICRDQMNRLADSYDQMAVAAE